MIRPDISQLNKNRSIFLKVGLIFSLSFVILAFNYTVYDYEQEVVMEPVFKLDNDIPVIRTKPFKKSLPPPPAVEISDKIEAVDEPDFVEEPIPEKIPIEIPVAENVKVVKAAPMPSKPRPKPPVVVIEEPDEEDLVHKKVWKIVEFMPEFGDCSAAKNKQERKLTSDKNLLTYIYKKIKYPVLARENGIEGPVVVRFIIDEAGNVIQPEILKEPGAGCGAEVLRIIKSMPKWKAGIQGDRPVKVQYNLPVRFHLQ